MTVGRKKLRKIQLGKETVGGTAVAATTIWRGAGNMLSDDRKLEEVEEYIGIVDGADRDQIVELLGMLDLGETQLTFEQFQYLLTMSAGGPVTGTADGVGSGKIYQTTVPTTTLPAPVPYTVQGGDDFEAEVMEYAVCTKWSIAGTWGKIATMNGSLMGRQVQRLSSGFTAALTAPAVEEVVTGKGKVYLDPVSGAYGATQVANQVRAFEVNGEFQWVPQFAMDGNLYYSLPVLTGQNISGKLTFYHEAAVAGATGVKADFRARTPKLLRLELIGGPLTTPGTAYSQKKIIVDLPIKYTKVGTIEDENGLATVAVEFRSRYNATAGNAGKLIVVNELASLP